MKYKSIKDVTQMDKIPYNRYNQSIAAATRFYKELPAKIAKKSSDSEYVIQVKLSIWRLEYSTSMILLIVNF